VLCTVEAGTCFLNLKRDLYCRVGGPLLIHGHTSNESRPWQQMSDGVGESFALVHALAQISRSRSRCHLRFDHQCRTGQHERMCGSRWHRQTGSCCCYTKIRRLPCFCSNGRKEKDGPARCVAVGWNPVNLTLFS
jgi:hypothetical protein